MSTAVKQMAALLAVTVAFSLAMLAVGGAFGVDDGDFALGHARVIFTGPLDNDSWLPMMQAWRHWKDSDGKAAIYSDLLIAGRLKFQYPPTALLVSKLIERYGIDVVAFCHATTLLFLSLTVAATAAIAYRSLRQSAPQVAAGTSGAALGVLVALLALSFYPIVKAGTLGQIQIWLGGLFAAALYLVMTGRMTAAGVLLGVMASIKPQYGLFALWGLLRGERALVVSMLGVTAIGLALGVAEFGIATYVDYLRALQFLSERGEAFYANQSFNGLANRLASVTQPETFSNTEWWDFHFPPYDPRVYAFTQITSLAVLAIALLASRGSRKDSRPFDFSLMALAATMASPIAWEHHYGILLPIFALLWPPTSLTPDAPGAPASRRVRALLLVCFLLSATFLPVLNLLAPSYWNVLQSYVLFAAIGVFAVLLYAVRHPFGARTASAAG